MTSSEMRQASGVLEHLSDWMLSVFEKYPKEISELAANERIVRATKKKGGSK